MDTIRVKKNWKLVSLALCSFLLFFSCTDDSIGDVSLKSSFETASFYDENNYDFNTISLWGSEAAVIDKGEYYSFQGDIRLYKADSLKFQSVDTRGAGRTDRKWPNNKVYYSVTGVPADVVPYISDAVEWIENGSYIDMELRYNQSDYIQFAVDDNMEDDFAAYSDYIGKKGGQQNIVIKSLYSRHVGIIAHEICHALGMYHEMCRTDRDQYIKINFEGMTDEMRHQYKTYAELGQPGINVGEFDFSSIMMYSSNGVMYTLDDRYIYGQRDSLSSTDMLTLAKIQPLGDDYMFFDKLGYNPPVYTDYEYQNSKVLQCPEGAKINFKFQYRNNVSASDYGDYSKNDFNIRGIISIVNRKNNKEVYHKEIPLSDTSAWIDVYVNDVNIPQGGFTTKLILKGSVNGTETSDKLNVLKWLLYEPQLYLHLDKVIIDGKEKHIPNEFGNENRISTYIDI